jgi:hypothetical protein
MPTPSIQQTLVAWLRHAGATQLDKRMSGGCIVLQHPTPVIYQDKPTTMYWYIGSGGSCRFGPKRTGNVNSPRRFKSFVGYDVQALAVSRILPSTARLVPTTPLSEMEPI